MANRFNKEKLINDTYTILSGNFSEYIKEEVLDAVCWAITERKELEEDFPQREQEYPKAKIKGCKYWSLAALNSAFNVVNGEYKPKKGFDSNKLRHEHVIPKAIIKNSIIKYQNQKKEIGDIFDKAFACVLTPGEAKEIDSNYKNTMPLGESNDDILKIKNLWARYIMSLKKISDIYEVTWECSSNTWKIKDIKKVEFEQE